MARKRTPTITPDEHIDDLLGGDSPPKKTKQQSVNATKRQVAKVKKRQDDKEEKRKVTLYLPAEMTYEIDDFVVKAKRWTADTGLTPSRSTIIEAAMFLALNDLNQNGEEGEVIQLVRRMLEERRE